jgi:predicted GNAT superfamily acetyltransferase
MPVTLSRNQAERASADAMAAAGDAGVNVVELQEMAEARDAADLFAECWLGVPPLSPNLLRAFAWAGNYVAGARRDERLVGASAAFVRLTAGGQFSRALFSQTTGVLPGTECRGVGHALKLHQRAWALARGITHVEWTFDPLVRRNAYFNLVKLGACGVEYLTDFYGAMTDGINEGDESDRLLIRWSLTDMAPRSAPDVLRLRAAGAPVLLEEGRELEPVLGGGDRGEVALARVPRDIVTLRGSNPALARAWRMALRAALVPAFDDGLVARSMTRTGWYVLAREGVAV